MTREDIITNLRYWCNNIDKPCEECKIHDICVVRDHVQIFDSMDDEKLQEYYELMYGSESRENGTGKSFRADNKNNLSRKNERRVTNERICKKLFGKRIQS